MIECRVDVCWWGHKIVIIAASPRTHQITHMPSGSRNKQYQEMSESVSAIQISDQLTLDELSDLVESSKTHTVDMWN